MANLFDNKSGQWVDVPDEQVPQAIHSGTHSFPKDITIPMLDDKGNPISVPSENAGKAFGYGFQLSNPAAADAAYQRQVDESRQAIAAQNPGTAFGWNAVNAAGFGLPNVAARVVGGDEATRTINASNEANPVASALGTGVGVGAGILASGGTGLAADIVGGGTRAAARIGESMGGAAAEAIARTPLAASGRVGEVLANLGSKALGSAAEGAYYGLGTGLSEAALGKPEDVVDNLVSNVGMGGLIGGAGSLAFGATNEAKGFLQDKAAAMASKGADVVSGASQAMSRRALQAALIARGESGLATEAGKLTPELIDAASSDAITAGQKELKNAHKDIAELQRQSDNMSKGIGAEVKAANKDTGDAVKTVMASVDGDVQKGIETFDNSYKDADKAFTAYRTNEMSQQPPVFVNETRALLRKTITNLRDLAVNDTEKSFVKELAETAEAQFGMPSRNSGFAADRAADAGQEINGAKRLRELVNQHNRDFSAFGQDFGTEIKQKFMPKLTDMYENQFPDKFAANALKDLRVYGEGRAILSKVADKEWPGMLMENPVIATRAGTVLGNITDFAPEFEKARLAVNDAVKTKAIQDAAYEKYNKLLLDRKFDGQKLNYEDFKAVFKDLQPSKSILDKMEKLKGVQDTINSAQNMSPLDVAIQVKRAMGKDVSNLEALAANHKNLELLSKIKDLKLDRSGAGLISRIPVINGVLNAAADPYRLVKSIQNIEKVAQAGARMLDSSIRVASNKLLGKAVENVAKKSAIQYEAKSMAETRANFNKTRTKLAELQNPQRFQDHMSASMSAVEGAPNVKAAVAGKLLSATQYLSSQMPQDPMAGTSIFANKTPFHPSDIEVSKFMRKVNAVSNPVGVIDRVASGQVTFDEIQALKAVHPSIYNKLQQNVIGAMMDHGEQIPYTKRLQISQLFNTPADFSMTPQFIGSMQQNYVKSDQGGRTEGATTGGVAKPNLKVPFENTQTMSDSITYRNNK